MTDVARHECSKCKVSWEAWLFSELGGWFYSRKQPGWTEAGAPFEAEERAYCPHCGEEGVVPEPEASYAR